MFLSELRDNQSGVISSLNFDADFARRLSDMGFCNGEKVQKTCTAAFGSPMLYSAKDSEVALRRCDASRIEVTL
ncbi:MAG: ferrous iron transport protein A [Ruminococcaceae bacterium]|nr:ferrous iron transport protein A [Oscillospiraceae bacterium]